jgi:hypothetical protein
MTTKTTTVDPSRLLKAKAVVLPFPIPKRKPPAPKLYPELSQQKRQRGIDATDDDDEDDY